MKFRQALVYVLVWALLVTAIGLLFDHLTVYNPTFPYSETLQSAPLWLRQFAQFDGVHYLTIETRGYTQVALIQAFFPVYPMLTSILTGFSTNTQLLIIVGRFISVLSLVVTVWLWPRLVRQFSSESGYHRSLILLLLWPTSFFLFALYTESLFLALVIVCLLLARSGHFLLAAMVGAVATGTRLVGVFLLPAVLIELWLQTRPVVPVFLPSVRWQVLWKWMRSQALTICGIFLILLGWLLYSTYLFFEFGDFLYYFHVQQEFGGGRQEQLILLPQVIFRYLKIALTASINWSWFISMQELLLTLIALVALVMGWKTVRSSIWFFSLCAVLLPTLTGTLSSMPRYLLVAPAVFLSLSVWGKAQPRLYLVLLFISLVLLLLNLFLFAQGAWVA